jgi:DNA-nicking Smr family endonuclease
MTNGEWIRAHDDKWLAAFIAEGEAIRRVEIVMHGAKGELIVKENIEKWLAQEYEEAQDDAKSRE